VTAFGLNEDTAHPPDFALLRDGGLALYRQWRVLEEAGQELRELGYEQVRLDASQWDDEEALRNAFASTFAFPDL